MSVFVEAGFEGINFNLKHPRICWNNIGRRATISASTAAEGFAAINAASPFTHSFWRPEATDSTFTMTLSQAEPVSYLAMSGHDLGEVGAQFDVELFVSGLWVSVSATISPQTDADLVVLFDQRIATAVRVTFSTATPTIAVIFAGDVIEVPLQQYANVGTPVDLASETDFMTNRSLRGAYVGRSVKRQRKVNEFPVSHVSEVWVRSVLAPFIEDAVFNPFFLAERPDGYADAVSYRWLDRDILPVRSGQNNLMSFTL